MKNLVLFILVLSMFWSCSLEDDSDNFDYEFVPIENVSIADTLIVNSVHTIVYSYYRPSTCHGFFDLYYKAEENERTVAVINTVFDNSNCESLEQNDDNLIEKTFNFKPLHEETYVFKFWTGVDDNGEDEFLTYEVVVEE